MFANTSEFRLCILEFRDSWIESERSRTLARSIYNTRRSFQSATCSQCVVFSSIRADRRFDTLNKLTRSEETMHLFGDVLCRAHVIYMFVFQSFVNAGLERRKDHEISVTLIYKSPLYSDHAARSSIVLRTRPSKRDRI
jgi:hypothetical protein